ncbi:MAG: hypothetical protein HN909_03285 [Phycisphaerales bacterium]|nr:hypothetical protein [Phycisphaerales bacterium]MBT7170775.1 hypothetical protein [Phycisphaerales bacterium]
MGCYGSVFRGLVANRVLRTHTRNEVRDDEVDSPELEALQSTAKRMHVKSHRHYRPRTGVVAFLSNWAFLLVVLFTVALGSLMMFGHLH